MNLPKHYTLKKEHDKSFEIHDGRDQSSFHVYKKDLHPATQIKIMKMQKLAYGGDVFSSDDSPGYEEKSDYGTSGRMSDQESKGGAESSGMMDAIFGEAHPSNRREEKAQSMPADVASEDTTPQLGTPSLQDQQQQAIASLQAEPDQVQGAQPQPQGVPGQAVPGGPMTSKGLQQIQKGYVGAVQAEANAKMAQNTEMSKQMALDQNEREVFNQKSQENEKNLNDEIQKQMQEVAGDKGKINPGRLWQNANGWQKAGAIIGIILGGFSQGLTRSGSNPAMALINQEIDRDIDAQKQDLGNKRSLLSDNLRRLGDMRQAENLTRMQMSADFNGRLAKIAAQTNNPVIQAQAQQHVQQYLMSTAPMTQQVAKYETTQQMRSALSKPPQEGQLRQEDPSSYVKFLVPEHQQEKAYEEIKNAQDIKALTPKIMDAFKMASSSNPAEAARGRKEYEGLMNTTVKEQEGTARQAAFDSIHKNMTPDYFNFGAGANAAKMRTTLEYLASKSSAPVAKGSGIDLSHFNSTAASQYHPNEGRVASDKKGNKIVIKDGKPVPYNGG